MPASSPSGVVVSNGDQVEIGIDPATAIVFHQGSATNATGGVSAYSNVITYFGYN